MLPLRAYSTVLETDSDNAGDDDPTRPTSGRPAAALCRTLRLLAQAHHDRPIQPGMLHRRVFSSLFRG